jgi:hypothetical protein
VDLFATSPRPHPLHSKKNQNQAAGCPVFLPPPRSRPPKGIVHFVGGAFAGASPALGYGLLLSLLADGGYTVIATPFAVSFRHAEAAAKVSAAFRAAVEELDGGGAGGTGVGVGLYSWAVRDERAGAGGAGTPLPVHGVGHSLGSLLLLLSCALSLPGTGDRASNVLLAFNNRPVGDAVPVSRGALAGAARAALDFSAAAAAALGNASGSSVSSGPPPSLSSKSLFDGALGALAAAGVRVPEATRAALADAAPAIDQLGSVAVEMAGPSPGSGGRGAAAAGAAAGARARAELGVGGGGGVEFVPSPEESRALIERGYSVPRTLLVRFENDTIDETPGMAALLRRVNAAGVSASTLPGSHVTPCGGELPSASGSGPSSSSSPSSPSAVDLLALGGAALLQADTRRLAASVLEWLDKVPRGGAAGGATALPPGGA